MGSAVFVEVCPSLDPVVVDTNEVVSTTSWVGFIQCDKSLGEIAEG